MTSVIDQALLEHARARVYERGSSVLEAFDVAAYTRELDRPSPQRHYEAFTPACRAMFGDLRRDFGPKGFALVHCAVMLDAIERFHERRPDDGYPDSILACFRRSFRRIVTKIDALDLEGYDEPANLLFKDLGICQQTLIPGGARVIEPVASFPRSLPFRDGLRQFVEASLFILFRAKGNSPFFNLHTHDFELGEFNEEGWRNLFLRLADLLERRPHMKGVFVGGGWLYDPQLPHVSPRLAYHLGLTLPNGARTFFYAWDTQDSYAFVKSATRRRLFKEGKYRPALYVLIWPRKPLLKWAEKYRRRAEEPDAGRRSTHTTDGT